MSNPSSYKGANVYTWYLVSFNSRYSHNERENVTFPFLPLIYILFLSCTFIPSQHMLYPLPTWNTTGKAQFETAEQWRNAIRDQLEKLQALQQQTQRELDLTTQGSSMWMGQRLGELGIPSWTTQPPPTMPPPALKAIDLRVVNEMLGNAAWVRRRESVVVVNDWWWGLVCSFTFYVLAFWLTSCRTIG